MKAAECEREVFILFQDKIKQSCKGRWSALEKEDRFSEASLIFLSVLRTPFLPEHKIWSTYLQMLDLHMPRLNQKEAREAFHFSLDAPIKRTNGEEGSAYIDFLEDGEEWKKQKKAEHFLLLLSEMERTVCAELIVNPSCRTAARTLKMPIAEIQKIRQRLGEKYIAFEQKQN